MNRITQVTEKCIDAQCNVVNKDSLIVIRSLDIVVSERNNWSSRSLFQWVSVVSGCHK